MLENEIKQGAEILALLDKVYGKEAEWQMKRTAYSIQIAKMLIDVADTFMRDADAVLERIHKASRQQTKKELGDMRTLIDRLHRIMKSHSLICFDGVDKEQSEDESDEVYQLVKAYVDHCNTEEDFKSVLNGINRRRLNNHIFNKPDDNTTTNH